MRVPLDCHHIITQENRRFHRHQAEECEQALQIDCFMCSQSQRNILGITRAKCHTPLLFRRPRDSATKRLSLKQKPEVDLRSSLSVPQWESEKPKNSRFSEQLHTTDRDSVPLRNWRRCFNGFYQGLTRIVLSCRQQSKYRVLATDKHIKFPTKLRYCFCLQIPSESSLFSLGQSILDCFV